TPASSRQTPLAASPTTETLTQQGEPPALAGGSVLSEPGAVATGFSSSPRPSVPTSQTKAPWRAPDFQAWLQRVSPTMTWNWRHQKLMYEYLEAVTKGEMKRLMIFMPPRHGKSELVTVRYAAKRLADDPSMNVIIGSYNQRLANRFSRKVRRVLADAQQSEPP